MLSSLVVCVCVSSRGTAVRTILSARLMSNYALPTSEVANGGERLGHTISDAKPLQDFLGYHLNFLIVFF